MSEVESGQAKGKRRQSTRDLGAYGSARWFPRVVLLLPFLLCGFTSPGNSGRAWVDSLNSLGRAYIFSNIELSVEQYDVVAERARALGYRAGEARAMQSRGVALYLNGRYEESVEVTLKAIRLFENLELHRELALTLGELGYEMKRRNLIRATAFMRRAIAIAEGEQDSLTLCTLYDNFGVLHGMADYPDSAEFFYRKALDYKVSLEDSLGIPFSLNNLSELLAQEGDYDEAEQLLARSDAIRKSTADSFGLLQNKAQWAELSLAGGDFSEAAERFERLLKNPAVLEHSAMAIYCYDRLATVYEQMKDYERAYRHRLRFSAYTDSLFSVENNARMAALELEFDTERKDRLLAESRLEAAAHARQTFFLVAVVAILIVSGLGIVRSQHQKRRQLRQELEWRERVNQIEHEQQLVDEKLRIARELHDNIGSQLTFMTSSIDNLAHQSEFKEPKQQLSRIGEFGRDTLRDLRQTVWAIKNEEGGFDALVAKLQDLKRQCGATDRRLEFECHRAADVRSELSSGRMLNIFRIAQEAVQNALKHTQDGTISMQLDATHEGLLLRIRDDGPGFCVGESEHVGGLAHMRLRCHDSGGTFDLSSGVEGTAVVCRFPPK